LENAWLPVRYFRIVYLYTREDTASVCPGASYRCHEVRVRGHTLKNDDRKEGKKYIYIESEIRLVSITCTVITWFHRYDFIRRDKQR